MKIIKDVQFKDYRRVTVELSDGEDIQAYCAGESLAIINLNAHYKLGEPMQDDVIAGHILADATRVTWCSIQQKWVD